MRRYVVVLIYPMTLQRKVLDVEAENKADVEMRMKILYETWRIEEIKEVIEPSDK